MKNILWLCQLNSMCAAFEGGWQSGESPRIEQFLEHIPRHHLPQLLRELLAIEVAHRRERGESLDASEFKARFPNQTDIVDDVISQPVDGDLDNPSLTLSFDTEIKLGGMESAPTLYWPRRRRPAPRLLPANTRIGSYDIIEEIGRGGMGVVYKARQIGLNRIVAVKMILSGEFANPHEIRRFRAEAGAIARLKHPNIVPIYEIGEDSGRQFFSMMYIDGPNLQQLLRYGPLPPNEAAELIQTIAEAIEHAHTQGFIHRDLKPGNILLDSSGKPHVTDFGLARDQASVGGLTATGEVVGTPGFIPPEQVGNFARQLGPTADVYSLGALLYVSLTGRPPFQCSNYIKTLKKVLEVDPTEPRLLNSRVPRDLETICLKCLQKNPARRFASARELVDDLQRYLNGDPIQSRRVGTFEKITRWCGRRPAVTGLISVSTAAIIAIVTLLWIHNRDLTEYNHQLGRLNDNLTTSAAKARELTSKAESNERQANDALYAADIARAAAAWHEADPRGLIEILDRHVPNPGGQDRRGFEWRYLRRQANLAHRVLLETEAPQYILRSTADRRSMAVAGMGAVVRIFDPETGAMTGQFATDQVEINGVAFSPDGASVATAGDDGTIRIRNFADGTERLKINAYPHKAFHVLFTRDGTRIICCGEDPMIRVFDADTGAEVGSLNAHDDDIHCLAADAEGRTLISGSSDGTVRIWNCDDWTEQCSLNTNGQCRTFVHLDGRNLLIAGTEFGDLQSFHLIGRRQISHMKHHDAIESLAPHPDGTMLAAGDRGGSIRLWNLSSSGELTESEIHAWEAHRGFVYSLAWSQDGAHLISCGSDGRVVRWNVAAADPGGVRRFEVHKGNASGYHGDFSLIPGSDRFVICMQGKASFIAEWNWKTGNQVCRFDAPENYRAGISPSADFLALALPGNELQIFPMKRDFRALPDIDRATHWQSESVVNSWKFSPDSSQLAVSCGVSENQSRNRVISLLDIPQLQRVDTIPVPNAWRFAFTPDGSRLAIATRSGLTLWDISNRTIAWQINQTDVIEQLAFSLDGRLVATGGDNRRVLVRNVSDGTTRYQLNSHRDRIRSLAFSPDGKTLATTDDGVVKLWHVPTGQELFELKIPQANSQQIAFTPDGKHLLWSIVPGKSDIHEIAVFDGTDEIGVE